MGVEAVIATQVIDTTTVGRSLMTAADAAAARTALSLGTLATQNGTISDYLTAATAASTYQVTLVSATNIKTVNGSTLLGSGDLAISGLSGTGSVDNAALRADGTGGATLQNSAFVIADNATASPNNTVNHASIQATGGTTNVSVSIVPKGSGAFTLAVPDGTSTGGNARGDNAIDLQATRTAAAQVASGTRSFVAGLGNTASGTNATAIGHANTVSGQNSGSIGVSNVVSGNQSFAFGNTHSVANDNAAAFGVYAATRMTGMRAVAQDSYDIQGGAQLIEVTNRNKSTSATPVNWDLPLTSGNTYHFNLIVAGVKSDGSAIACYSRRVSAKNVGGTVTIVNNQTIGTDYEDNASTDIAITASGSNVRISMTGIASETWRWQFALHGVEIKYGT